MFFLNDFSNFDKNVYRQKWFKNGEMSMFIISSQYIITFSIDKQQYKSISMTIGQSLQENVNFCLIKPCGHEVFKINISTSTNIHRYIPQRIKN